MESVVYQSPDVFSFHYFFQVAVHVHVENVDGQMVFLAHRSCGEVHYFQAFVVDFIVCDFTERIHALYVRSGAGTDPRHDRRWCRIHHQGLAWRKQGRQAKQEK